MDLKLELISLAKNFEVLQLALPVNVDSSCEASCRKCAVCALAIIGANRLNEKSYDNSYQAYTFICTLSMTPVQCERSFSKLKIIKTRLRSSLSDDLLEEYMIMSIEKQLVDELNNDEMIDQLASTSTQMNKLLSF